MRVWVCKICDSNNQVADTLPTSLICGVCGAEFSVNEVFDIEATSSSKTTEYSCEKSTERKRLSKTGKLFLAAISLLILLGISVTVYFGYIKPNHIFESKKTNSSVKETKDKKDHDGGNGSKLEIGVVPDFTRNLDDVEPTEETTVETEETTDDSCELNLDNFIYRLFVLILEREPNQSENDYWQNRFMMGLSGSDCAYEFFISNEYAILQDTDEEYVTKLYLVFLDREPDTDGFNYWINQLNNGSSRDEIFDGFANSVEWADLCLLRGILAGGTAVPSIEVEPSDEVVSFVKSIYFKSSSTELSADELYDCAKELVNRRITCGEVIHSFIFSDYNVTSYGTDRDFVVALYQIMFDRIPSEEEINYWTNQLNGDTDYETLFKQFADSDEFKKICFKYSIG
ncbi:MAG: DUF4214 domain-containing protein [Clostridia bacterium]|nr:DUF4214 domain-containing protein [Clostridia bacterium]